MGTQPCRVAKCKGQRKNNIVNPEGVIIFECPKCKEPSYTEPHEDTEVTRSNLKAIKKMSGLENVGKELEEALAAGLTLVYTSEGILDVREL